MLVAHEANIYLDRFDGKQGLTYARKTPLDGSFSDRLRFVFRAALEACQLLEADSALPGVKFRVSEADFKINDRLLAPNTPETYASVKPDLEKFAKALYGGNVTLEHRGNAKQLFEVAIRAGGDINLAMLLGRLKA